MNIRQKHYRRLRTRSAALWSAAVAKAGCIAAASGIVLGSATPAIAQNAGSASARTAAGQSAQATQNLKNYRGLRASQVIGMSVRNPQGQNIGQISDMLVDMKTGAVHYTMLRFDPGVFQGEKLFAVPTTELRMGADRNDIVYDMSRERLEQAAVDQADWNTALDTPDYLARLDRVWGVTRPSRTERAYRASDLLGADVNDRRGEEIGELEELVVDMANQRIHYAVLEFDPSWTSPERNYAFPLSAFDVRASKELVLDANRSQVRAMRSFTDDQYSRLNDPVWVADVDRYLVAVLPVVPGQGSSTAGTASDTNTASASPAGISDTATTAASATGTVGGTNDAGVRTDVGRATTGATGMRAMRPDRN